MENIPQNSNILQKLLTSKFGPQSRPEGAIFHSLIRELVGNEFFFLSAGFTSEHKQNANAAFENDVNVRCRHVTEVRQTAFGCATNVWRTVECYQSTVGKSKAASTLEQKPTRGRPRQGMRSNVDV